MEQPNRHSSVDTSMTAVEYVLLAAERNRNALAFLDTRNNRVPAGIQSRAREIINFLMSNDIAAFVDRGVKEKEWEIATGTYCAATFFGALLAYIADNRTDWFVEFCESTMLDNVEAINLTEDYVKTKLS